MKFDSMMLELRNSERLDLIRVNDTFEIESHFCSYFLQWLSDTRRPEDRTTS